MKKLSSIMMIALAGLAFQACKSGTSSSSTDSTATTKDSTATTTAVTAPVDKGDSTFVVTAAADGMAEVAAGKMAGEKTMNPKIKSFAMMMVTDHSKAGDELAAIAKTKSIPIPSAPDSGSQAKAAMLSKMSGKAFDKAYISAMVDGHNKAVKLFTDASQNCKDADLKAFATKTLPTLKMHLDSVNALQASMK